MRGLWIVLLCLALGVAAIAAVGTLRAAIDRGLAARRPRASSAATCEIDGGSQPLPDALRAWLRARGATAVRRRADALDAGGAVGRAAAGRAEGGGCRLAAGRRAGAVAAQPLAQALAAHDGHYGLLAEQVVLDRLGLHPGDTVRLGNATLPRRGALVSEPDRVATPSLLGPRVLIALAALPPTGLIVPGSIVRYALRLTLPHPAAAAALAAQHPRSVSRTPAGASATRATPRPGSTRFIDQTSLFLTLVGLTSLLVGGIGVANGVRAWLDARARTIATLRCLGASRAAGVRGLPDPGAGAGGWPASSPGWSPARPCRWRPWCCCAACCRCRRCWASIPAPLALAAAYGLLTALAFALWPLGRAARIPGARAVPRRAAAGARARRRPG